MSAVSLFTREWIEIESIQDLITDEMVSLFTREWIEMLITSHFIPRMYRLPLYEGVD